MSNVVGEPFAPFVAEQINIRQNTHGAIDRSLEDLQVLNQKTAWIKLASGVGLTQSKLVTKSFTNIGDGIDLARRYVLFGGVSSLNEATSNGKTYDYLRQRGTPYQGQTTRDNVIDSLTGMYNVNANELTVNQDFGYVPMPGIESADIKNLNRGSIKKAEIKLKAYNKEQFDILDVLYMRLGYTVLLEWGNSLYKNNESKIIRDYFTLVEAEDGIFQKETQTHRDMLSKIEGYRTKYNGNYDGLLAKVSNFNWDFNPDGSYDINLTLISLGDVIESLKTNITPPSKSLKFVSSFLQTLESGETQPTTIETSAKNNVISANMLYYKIYATNNDIHDQEPEIFYNLVNDTIGIGNFVNIPSQFSITSEEFNFSKKFSSLEDAQTYADNFEKGLRVIDNWEWNRTKQLETRWQGPIGKLSIDGKLSVDVSLSTQSTNGDVIYFKYDNDTETDIEDSGFYMRLGYLLHIIDNECIPRTGTDKEADRLINIDYSALDSKMLCYPNQYSFDPQVCLVRSIVHNKTENIADLFPQLQIWREGQTGFAYTMNIYVNFVAIQDAIDSNLDDRGNLALYPFLETICTKINESLGGINNLEPIIDEEENKIRIIDGSYSYDNIEKEPYTLEVYGYNGSSPVSTFVRNLNLKTEITPEYATMITVGATAGGYVKGTDGTMFSRWNKGINDRFKEKYVSPNKETADNPDEVRDDFYTNVYVAGTNMIGYKSVDGSRSLDPDIISSNVAFATEYYKYLNAKLQERNPDFSPTTIGFVPFVLGVTVDGISGIKIYNKLNVNTSFLPTNYPKTLNFIIKAVNHKLSNQDWETTLETVVIPQTMKTIDSYRELKDLINEHMGLLSTQGGPVVNALTAPFSNPALIAPSKSQTGSELEIKTKKASITWFTETPGNINRLTCGKGTYNAAYKLAKSLKTISFPAKDGNDAFSNVLRTHLYELGIYTKESLTPVLTNANRNISRAKANEITKLANYGDVLVYFALPAGIENDRKSGGGFHAQIYTGNQYKEGVWSSSLPGNYGANWVYGEATKNFNMYWFRIKDEYKK